MKTLHAVGAAAAVATLALLAGCSASGTAASLPEDRGSEPAAVPAPADAGGKAEDYADDGTIAEGKPSGVPGTSVTPQLARTARVSLTVTDADAAATQLRGIATSMGGQVTAENLVTQADADAKRGPISTIVISVPADRLDSTLDQLKSVGPITNRVISSEDVTTQVADVESRVRTLNDSIARLRELSKKAGSIRDLTELESQLTERISERDSLIAQQRSLAGRVAQSPITITLNTPEQPVEVETGGFIGGLIAGWNALLASSRVLMTVLGAVLPFAAVVAVVAVPLLLWRRHIRRRRASATTSSGGPAQPSAGSSE